jgi:glucose-6-phosphate 1-dehydrogenase
MPDTQPIRVPSSSQTVESPPRRRAKPADPCVLVIFGAGGDLTIRLVVPALYNLARTKLLPEDFALIGIGYGEDSRPVARTSLRHAEDLRRQRQSRGPRVDQAARRGSRAG